MIYLPSLAQYFDSRVRIGTGYEWVSFSLRQDEEALAGATGVLAWYIMLLRCAGAPRHFASWLDAVHGSQLDARSQAALAAFVRPGFGVPANPTEPDHVHATVAEHLWFVLHLETASDRGLDLRHAETPKLHVTSPGGDGLVAQDGLNGLEYRLWELKKHTSQSAVSRTVSVAYRQLKDRALEYLAEYTALGPALSDTRLQGLYAGLVDAWLDGGPESGAGIGVGSIASPSKCFSTFPSHFPELAEPPRLEGFLASVAAFDVFSMSVRGLVWTGL